MMNDNNNDGSMRATIGMQRANIDDTQQIPISFEDDDNPLYEQPRAAYGSGNNIPLADNYTVNTNDNKARKPMLKRPLFWVVFLIIMLAMLATMHPFTTTHTNNAPASTSNTTTSTTTVKPKPAPPVDELTKRANAFDWDSLKGQKLSNAYQIMKYNQIDPLKMDISIVTDTGEHVIIQSNWIVNSVEYDGNKHILFHVTKDKNALSLSSLNKNDNSNASNDNNDSNGSDSGIDTSRINDTLTKGYNTVKGALNDYFNKTSSSSSPGIKIMTYKPFINN